MATSFVATGVELLGEQPGSGYQQPPCLVRRADGQVVSLTPLLYAVLVALREQEDLAAAAVQVSAAVDRDVTPRDVLVLAQTKLAPLGLLRGADGSEPVTRRASPLLALTFRLRLCGPEGSARWAAGLSWLFHPVLVGLALVGFVALSWWLYVRHGLSTAAFQAFYQPETLLLVWGLVLLSAAVHELGHVAACRYGGARPGAMGAGLYLIWPAFYTDVSDSHRLGKAGRLRVDLGGLYFNILFAAAMVVWWWLTGTEALLLVVMAQHLQMLRQCAPFIRADGYHVVSDLVGVPDLFAHVGPTLRSWVPRALAPRSWRDRPPPRLKRWARWVVTAWVAVTVPLLIGMLAMAVHLLPTLAATAYDSLGIQKDLAAARIQEGDLAAALVSLLYAVAVTTPVLFIVLLLLRLVSRSGRRAWSATREHPGKRALVVLATLALTTLVALSWWPGERYEPIRSDGSIAVRDPALSGVLRVAGADAARADASQVVAPAAGRATGIVLPDSTRIFLVTDRAGGGEPAAYGVVQPPTGEVWAFPWPEPPPPLPGDNRALAVNTVDDTTVTALAIAWAIVDGSTVLERNEAHAYASCDRCEAVAAAFQVLLVMGSPEIVVPVNAAVAATYDCVECHTTALAVQLVVSLTAAPSAQATALVEQAVAELAAWADRVDELSVAQLYTLLIGTRDEILAILEEDGVVAPTEAPSSTTAEPSPTPEPTTAPETSPSEPSTSPEPSPTEPSGEPTPGPTPEPTDATSPTTTP